VEKKMQTEEGVSRHGPQSHGRQDKTKQKRTGKIKTCMRCATDCLGSAFFFPFLQKKKKETCGGEKWACTVERTAKE
jgi:hypothetical protein